MFCTLASDAALFGPDGHINFWHSYVPPTNCKWRCAKTFNNYKLAGNNLKECNFLNGIHV